MQIGIIVGSLRAESLNRRLAEDVVALLGDRVDPVWIAIDDLPLYNQDTENEPGASVVRLRQELANCVGVIFASPEYNRSIPGVLKNALDHASRPRGRNALAGKPVGILGVSLGPVGTAMAQQHLRAVLHCLDAPAMGQPDVFLRAGEPAFDGQGCLSPDLRKFLEGWSAKFLAWVKLHHGTGPA